MNDTMTATLRATQARHAVHTVDWDYVASLTGAALETALADVTGIRCDDARSDGATTERALLLDDAAWHGVGSSASLLHSDAGQTETRSTLAVIRETSCTVPDMTTALVLSAVMHGDSAPWPITSPSVDVLTRGGRVVLTRLAAHLGGADKRLTGQALVAALDHLARGTLDVLDAHGPATVDCDHDYTGIATIDPAARRAATHAARLADVHAARFIGRTSFPEPEPADVVFSLTRPRPWCAPAPEQDHTPNMTARRDGWRLASLLLGNDGSGNGTGTTPSGLPSRDALRRVPLAAGSTIRHESLADCLTRDSGRASAIPGTLTLAGIPRASWMLAGMSEPCQGITRTGAPCRRMIVGGGYCPQHAGTARRHVPIGTDRADIPVSSASPVRALQDAAFALATLRARGPRH